MALDIGQERIALTVVGCLALTGLGLLAWRQQRESLTVVGAPTSAQTAGWDAALRRARVVDVNRATAAELERLPQVGPALARRIVEDRQRRGRFRTAAELSRVDGIGPQTVAALAAYVTVEPSGE